MGQPSRKGKKAWRTNVDISSIEEALASKRSDEIEGVDRNVPFVIDTVGKPALRGKGLKMDEILRPSSAIAGIKRPVKDSAVAVGIKSKEVNENGRKVKKISKNLKMTLERMAARKKELGQGVGYSKLQKEAERRAKLEEAEKAKGGFDLWNETEKPAKKTRTVYSCIKNTTAVSIAHPGISYNPDPTMHAEAIKKAAEPEFRKIDHNQSIKHQLSYPKELDELDDNLDLVEIKDSLSEDEQPEISVSNVKKRLPKMKTQADRNRKDRAHQQKLQENLIKEQKNINKQINL